MRKTTRKLLLNLATGVAVAATAVVVFLPAAQAAPGTTTTAVNVRSGPGTNFGVVTSFAPSTRVEVDYCQGSWCYVSRPSAGWVSSSYLNVRGGLPSGSSSGPSVNFGISIGPDGRPDVNIGVGNQPQRPPVGRPDAGRPPVGRPPVGRPPVGRPVVEEVCFYERSNFRGESMCLESGDSVRDLGRFADRISSIDNPEGLNVTVCSEANFRNCRTYTTSASTLGSYDDYIVSVRIR